MHEGIDFRADIGSEVFATGDGVVKFVGRNGNYGRTIEIDHGFGFVSRYTHLSGYLEGLRRGDTVKRGDLIGFTGESGLTKGPHLHYEILVEGKAVNPLNYLIADVTPEEYHYFKNSENQVEQTYTLAN
jgi:murein DD-endopeptidase MepM/ murein hydrolase activator NlpD